MYMLEGLSSNTGKRLMGISVGAPQDFLKRLKYFLEGNLRNPDLTAEFVASMMGVSKSTLNRRLKGLSGLSINRLITKVRLEESQRLLREGHEVRRVSIMVGFSSASYFTFCFKKHFGCTPMAFTGRSLPETPEERSERSNPVNIN